VVGIGSCASHPEAPSEHRIYASVEAANDSHEEACCCGAHHSTCSRSAKALLRILIAELRVNGKTDIQPTYRIITPDRTHTARVCATSGKVETAGIEPASAIAYEWLLRA